MKEAHAALRMLLQDDVPETRAYLVATLPDLYCHNLAGHYTESNWPITGCLLLIQAEFPGKWVQMKRRVALQHAALGGTQFEVVAM